MVEICPVDAVEPDEEGEQKCYSPDPKPTGPIETDDEIDDEIAEQKTRSDRTVAGGTRWVVGLVGRETGV